MTLLSFLSILLLLLKTVDREMVLLSTEESHHVPLPFSLPLEIKVEKWIM